MINNGLLWLELDKTLRVLTGTYGTRIGDLGLNMVEWYILRELYQKDGQNPSELARRLGRPATSFTPNLDGLEKKGLIERQPDRGDRRAVKICLTRKGGHLRESVEQLATELDASLPDPVAQYQEILSQCLVQLRQGQYI